MTTRAIMGGAFISFGVDDAKAIRSGRPPVKCTAEAFSEYKRSALDVWASVIHISSRGAALEHGLGETRAERSPMLTRLSTEFEEFVPEGRADGRRFALLRCDYPDKVIGVMTDGIAFFNDVAFTDASESTAEERDRIWGAMESRFRDYSATERVDEDAAE